MDRAREAAFRCVRAVQADDAYANLALPGILAQLSLGGRDAAFATELAYGTLRMRGLYDAIIAKGANRAPETLDPAVRWCLWLGAHQVLGMRVPAHAAVSQTVSLARENAGERTAKFVNAVMRRISERTREEWIALVAPGAGRDALATRYSHPTWVVGQLQDALTADGRAGELEALLEADNTPAAVTLVARPGLIGRDELAAAGEPTALSPWGVTLAGGDPSTIGAIGSGTAAVQDEGSQLVAGALVTAQEVEADERWLDMCAGPGGKAGLLGALAAQHGATLEARELHPHRADLVLAAVRAIPAGTVTVSVGDARDLDGGFDRVLLDAPCTGLGALRRRPEARWRRGGDDLDELVTLQRQLLATAARVVRPGGLVAYITCSPVLAETRDVVAGARGLDTIDARPAMALLTNTDESDWGRGPHIQLWPHAHATDAMFLALFRRPGAEDGTARQ